jgi:hypothetical protein
VKDAVNVDAILQSHFGSEWPRAFPEQNTSAKLLSKEVGITPKINYQMW